MKAGASNPCQPAMQSGLDCNTPTGGLGRVAKSNPHWSHGGDMASETPTTLSVQANPDHATLSPNPDMAELPMNGFTPRGACQPVVAEGVRTEQLDCVFGVGTPTASACAQDTRLGAPGQRTGRGQSTQARAGVRA